MRILAILLVLVSGCAQLPQNPIDGPHEIRVEEMLRYIDASCQLRFKTSELRRECVDREIDLFSMMDHE